ncbi:MAG: hypothetical protein ACYDH3_00025 [Candidatus Aminicenantales bacterium]
MKKKFSFAILTIVLMLGIGMLTGQVPGKYLGFTADRYWSNAGVICTDGAIIPKGGINYATVIPAGTVGSLVTTGTTWVQFPTAGMSGMKLLLENTASTGEFATLRMRAGSKSTTVSGNGGNSVGTTTCIDASASARASEYGNLKAVNAVAQPDAYNQTVDASNIVTALYGRVDRTGTSVGRTWVGWIDTHQTTKSDAGDYLLRLSHNGTVANDGAITVYNGGRMPVLFNFEDAAGFLTDSDGSHTVASGAIAVKTPAGTKYIVLYN